MATTDPSAMLIQWVTKNAPTPTVKYGLTSGQYTKSTVVSNPQPAQHATFPMQPGSISLKWPAAKSPLASRVYRGLETCLP